MQYATDRNVRASYQRDADPHCYATCATDMFGELNSNSDLQQGTVMVNSIVAALRGHVLFVVSDETGTDWGFRILADSLRWTIGDGSPSSTRPSSFTITPPEVESK